MALATEDPASDPAGAAIGAGGRPVRAVALSLFLVLAILFLALAAVPRTQAGLPAPLAPLSPWLPAASMADAAAPQAGLGVVVIDATFLTAAAAADPALPPALSASLGGPVTLVLELPPDALALGDAALAGLSRSGAGVASGAMLRVTAPGSPWRLRLLPAGPVASAVFTSHS